MKLIRKIVANTVELVCGLAMIVIGVIQQVHGTAAKPSDATSVVLGGILIAFGGVLLSWIASRAFAKQQAEESASEARGAIDDKLDNLSRVLGQAAGQISQAVEQYELSQLSPTTGFALISQANRMIYGQVNEIAVIRGTSFDSAYLIETASKLDGLARELSASGTPETSSIDSVRQRIEDVRADLATANASAGRSYQGEDVACPYCRVKTTVTLGSVPGDTAGAVCPVCHEPFNTHRASTGSAFTRKRGGSVNGAPFEGTSPRPAMWYYKCPSCDAGIGAAKRGKGARLMACPACFAAIMADADQETATGDGVFRREIATTFTKAGSRPKVNCPDCGRPINAAISCDDGFFGLCSVDRVAIIVRQSDYDAFLLAEPRALPLSN